MVIDRFEGAYAVCESQAGTLYDVPREALPASAREGDVVVAMANGRLVVDAEATCERSKRIRALHDRLFDARESRG